MAREYFIRADQGRPDLLELFHEDAEIYFPKFGRGFGRESFFEMVKGFEGSLEYIRHDYDTLHFMPSGDFVAVEGTSRGRLSGKSWAGGDTPGGRERDGPLGLGGRCVPPQQGRCASSLAPSCAT